MQTEFEVKFLNIDIDKIREKLNQQNAKLINPMRMMKRAIFETPEMKQKDSFIRVRDEGDKVTLTYKMHQSEAIDGAKEIEINVSDFDNAVGIINAINIPLKSVQESKRETWTLNNTEIVIDIWPWLNPYIEIEGNNEEEIKDTTAKIGLDWIEVKYGDVMVAYRDQYKHLKRTDTVANIKAVRFNDPLPDLFKENN